LSASLTEISRLRAKVKELDTELASVRVALRNAEAQTDRAKQSISFKLGEILLKAFRSPREFLLLPKSLLELRSYAKARRALRLKCHGEKSALSQATTPQRESTCASHHLQETLQLRRVLVLSRAESETELAIEWLRTQNTNTELIVILPERDAIPVPEPRHVRFVSYEEAALISIESLQVSDLEDATVELVCWNGEVLVPPREPQMNVLDWLTEQKR